MYEYYDLQKKWRKVRPHINHPELQAVLVKDFNKYTWGRWRQNSAFERLFAFLVLGLGRRQLLWFEVTRHPTAEWLARQITEAFPWASAPAYLVRDNDRAYGHAFRSRVRAMGIRDRPISPDLALGKDAPLGRAVQRSGVIVAIPILSGLHHQAHHTRHRLSAPLFGAYTIKACVRT